MRIRYRACTRVTLGLPLVCAARALRQLPFVLEQILEEVVGPLRRLAGPCDFQAAANCITRDTCGVGVRPAEPLLLDGRAFRFGTHVSGGPGAMSLAEGVTASNQRYSLFIVHRHAAECFSDILGGFERIRIKVRAFRIDVDQAHMRGAVRLGQFAITGETLLRAHPLVFKSPVDVHVRLPNVGTAACEAEGLEAHRLESDVAGKDHEISPRDLLAVLLLDWPQQTPSAVEIDVVRPAVEGSETLLASAATSAAIPNSIGACAVPCHADEQRTVVAEVCGPPVLRVGHQCVEVI